jgi:dephospho-CoA kinase
LGAPIFDADAAAHALMDKGGAACAAVKAEFADKLGLDILSDGGQIDRKKLGAAVFGDRALLERLERHLHSLVAQNMEEFVRQAEKSGDRAMVADIPLLIEKSWQNRVDRIWLVYLPQELQLNRLCQRDRISAAKARQRVDAQLPLAEKLKYADLVIDNSGGRAKTVRAAKQAWENLLAEL